eukprot:TRINITY_DN56340_c0_g1_i1.p1 TRINITY_DN56340_c0_g1~~TRINITY_DN56340_c0_g1_i1.p1  ORF type:complete len:314 (-),score=66.46 TRINITY_DN56340_c0_g1_i1:656-1597(-)
MNFFGSLAVYLLVHIAYASDAYPKGMENNVVLHEHSLLPPFIEDYWQGGVENWDFSGHTVVTSHFIRLVPHRQNRFGAMWNAATIDRPKWEADIGFRIHYPSTPGADGFALWYVQEPFLPVKHPGRDGVDHLFGLPTSFNGFGIIFDTYDNDANRDVPAVVVVTNDGSKKEWDVDKDLATSSALRCPYELRAPYANDVVYLRMFVDTEAGTVQIWLRHDDGGRDHYCGEAKVNVPKGGRLGLTATTGHLADTHDIYKLEVAAPSRGAQDDDGKFHSEAQEHADAVKFETGGSSDIHLPHDGDAAAGDSGNPTR